MSYMGMDDFINEIKRSADDAIADVVVDDLVSEARAHGFSTADSIQIEVVDTDGNPVAIDEAKVRARANEILAGN